MGFDGVGLDATGSVRLKRSVHDNTQHPDPAARISEVSSHLYEL